MSGVKSSFAKVSEQIISYNQNVLDLISKLDELTTSDSSSVKVDFTDQFGVLSEYQVPSMGYLKSEITRLNNNLNSLYSIDSNGSLIQGPTNKFKRIITVDLNQEPNTIDSLNNVTTFKKRKNWFFDSLLNPMLNIELDLTDRISDDVSNVLVRRYIVDFNKDQDGNLTALGRSALNSFNDNFRGKSNLELEDFENWHRTTPGVVSASNPNYDQDMFKIEPNELLYDGTFTVLKTEEDTLNRKMWFHLNTLEYVITETKESQQLNIDDELILNQANSTTRYKVVEISTSASNPRIRVERIEGLEPISVGVGTLKIYSPVIRNKKVNISVGYDERNIVFLKALNSQTNIIAKDWSVGIGYWTNDLTLNSTDDDNGKNMEQFYSEKVFDYGAVLQDLVAKKLPDAVGAIPNVPSVDAENFKVVQVNRHLTDNADVNLLKSKNNRQKQLKSEMSQLDEAINNKRKELKIKRFASTAQKTQFENEVEQLQRKKKTTSSLLTSTISEIISLSNVAANKSRAKYRLRGFWEMPEPTIVRGSRPQEVVQFIVEYRYVSTSGDEAPVETFNLSDNDGNTSTSAAFSNWVEFKTDARKRIKDESTGEYFWEIQDVADADTPNINQLDIPIQSGERVQIRIKSLSEVGYPESALESDWSQIIEKDFPDNLNDVLNEEEFILKEASQEELRANIESDLSARGLDNHLQDAITIEDREFFHNSDKILSGFRDDNNRSLDVYEYLTNLTDRVKSLEEQIARSKGELKVMMFRNNDEFTIKNNSEISFNVECEDYLTKAEGSNVPSGRVYDNDIYVIKDFLLRVENVASSSPLGLLSNRTYYTNSELFNTSAPQVFWVNSRDELLFNDSTGNTRTQLNNQFIWSVNYDSIDDVNTVKLAENIGNAFSNAGSNSLTSYLNSTEFNIGYNENSILEFVSFNNSLLETEKWVDTSVSVASNTKLLTTIHPVIQSLDDIVEKNTDRVRVIQPGEDNGLVIPINIYFKMNSIDPDSGTGNNFEYINLNKNKKTVKHIKKVKFLLENEADNRPFIFTVKFNINRSKVGIQKLNTNNKLTLSPSTK